MKRILVILMALPLLWSCGEASIPAPERCDVVLFDQPILAHPRLLFTTEDEARIKRLAKSDEQVEQFVDRLLLDASRTLEKEQIMVGPKNFGHLPNLLSTASEYASRLITLSMANRFEHDQRYIDKVNETLIHLCTHFPSWNPAHYLDVAEMTCGVSLAYDWCYNELPESTLRLVEKTIKSYALDNAIREYDSGDDVRSWAKRGNNWNVICNTAMTLGALATAEIDPALTERVITETVKYAPRCLDHYAPDGTCFEGAGYWNFTNIHLVMLLRAMDDNILTTLGLAELPGVSKAGQFFISTVSPITNLAFNFADSGRGGPQDVPAYFYFSREFNQPEVAAFYRNIIAEKLEDKDSKLRCFFYLGLAWYDESSADDVPYKPIQYFRGINDFIVMQGEKSDPNYLYMIAKGGDPDCSHQQMDAGTFVIDKYGERWYDDMGSDNYALPGFWKYAPDGQRWNYFRNTNLCHNTISIDDKLHYSRGVAKISAVDSLTNSVTIDMTSLFNGDAESVNRTFRLVDNQTVEIVDKIIPTEKMSEITWGGVTLSDITIENDKVIMSQNGKQLITEFECHGAQVEISTKRAEPKHKLEKAMDQYHFVEVRLKNLDPEVTFKATMY